MSKLTDEDLLSELKKRFDENAKTMFELRKLNEQLMEVNKKLTESEALKSHFISNITNEIINPFASILGLAKNISILEAGKSEQIKKMAELIHSEAFILDFQLKNIFAAAEIESGEINPHISVVDIRNTINSTIDSFNHEISKKDLKIEIKINSTDGASTILFKSDAEKLAIILANLLSNAIKFSYDKAVIYFDVAVVDKILVISVIDHGIGISAENQKIIFDRFKRIDTGINSLNRGHGLGLSVIKAFLDILYGKIEIESEQGKGAKFTISVPESEEDVSDFSVDGNEFFFENDQIL